MNRRHTLRSGRSRGGGQWPATSEGGSMQITMGPAHACRPRHPGHAKRSCKETYICAASLLNAASRQCTCGRDSKNDKRLPLSSLSLACSRRLAGAPRMLVHFDKDAANLILHFLNHSPLSSHTEFKYWRAHDPAVEALFSHLRAMTFRNNNAAGCARTFIPDKNDLLRKDRLIASKTRE